MMNIDEILTGTIGFIIAMVIIGAAIGGAIYGYYTYAQHQILENYLWPIVEAVPAQGGGYWLTVINTGHEPLFVKYLIYPSGKSQTVNSGTLYQNQHWMTQLSQLPTEVMVCSAVNPSVCVTAPVHGWYVANTNTATFNGPGSSGLIEVIVNDPYGASWQVQWSYAGQTYTQSGSNTYEWYINPPYVPIQINFTAKITQNPTGYTCQIQPSSITNTYNAGSIQKFNVTCSLAPITVTVSDPYGAGWNVTWSGAASGSQSGSSSTSWTINPTSNGTITFTASITSTPSGYSSCTITPQTTTVIPGQSVTFTISCSGGTSGGGGSSSYTVTVYVYAPSGVSWTTYLDEDEAGAIFYVDYWSGTGNGGPYTATVTSGLTYLFEVKNLPSGCTASGSPYGIGQTFTPSSSFTETITITCSNYQPPQPQECTYTYTTSISADKTFYGTPPNMCTGPSSLSVNSTGQYQCTAQLKLTDSQGDVFKFLAWDSVTVTPSNYGQSQGLTSGTSVEGALYCPAPASVLVQGTASYKFEGCSSYNVQFTEALASNGQGSATFEWNFCPDDSAQSWQTNPSANGNSLTVQAIVYAGYGYGQASITLDNLCPSSYTVENPSTSPSGGSASGSSGTVSFNIYYTCAPPGGLNGG